MAVKTQPLEPTPVFYNSFILYHQFLVSRARCVTAQYGEFIIAFF
jgi:hypothetical protein